VWHMSLQEDGRKRRVRKAHMGRERRRRKLNGGSLVPMRCGHSVKRWGDDE
jgi:hypothetical protein